MRSHSIYLVALLLLSAGCSATHQTSHNFASASVSQPEFFPIMTWEPRSRSTKGASTQPAGLESIAQCNFNTTAFVFPEELPRCEKLGLGAIVLPGDAAYTDFNRTRGWTNLSDAEIDRQIKATVDAAGASPAAAGFLIMDEPGAMDFPALAKAVAAVKKYAPGKLAYINLYPDYATLGAPDTSQLGTASYTEYLERFVSEVHPQLISYDNYMVQYSGDLANPGVAASYYRNLLAVRRVAQEHHLPYLNIVASTQLRPEGTPPSPANLLFQAYTTLAAGYRGVTWYTYYTWGTPGSPINATGHKTATWAWLQDVNRQVATLEPAMSRLTSTGVFFSAPAPVDGLPMLPGKWVASVTCPTPLMVGEFQDRDGQPYAMVVNLSLAKSARFKFKATQPFGKISIISAMDGSATPFPFNEGYWLTAGQGVLLKLDK